MIGIVIVSHGGLAREYLTTLEHVLGEDTGAVAVSIGPSDSMATKQAEIDAAILAVDQGDGVAVLTDLFGSTPSNLAMGACRKTNRVMMYGMNMPMLVQLAKCRRKPMHEAVNSALHAARKYINSVDGYGPDRLPIAL